MLSMQASAFRLHMYCTGYTLQYYLHSRLYIGPWPQVNKLRTYVRFRSNASLL
jgi:hypothetical protein